MVTREVWSLAAASRSASDDGNEKHSVADGMSGAGNRFGMAMQIWRYDLLGFGSNHKN